MKKVKIYVTTNILGIRRLKEKYSYIKPTVFSTFDYLAQISFFFLHSKLYIWSIKKNGKRTGESHYTEFS